MRYALTLIFLLIAVPASAAIEIGQRAPVLKGTMLDGKSFDLATMKGKVVLVHYWATWCGPCQQEMPQIDAYFRKHHTDGLEMIAVSVDRAKEAENVKGVMKKFAFPAAMLSDVTDSGFGMPKEIPETFVVDQTGIVRAVLLPDHDTLTEQSLGKVVSPILRR